MLPLLTTKLHHPPARPAEVARPQLIERLNEIFQRRLAVLSAPAGFGKTTLLVEWIHSIQAREHPNAAPSFAWLSLDEADNDPVRFCAYLIAALQTAQPGLGSGVQALLGSPQAAQLASPLVMTGLALTPLINELAERERGLVLILDDYHLVEHPAVHAALAFLLEHLPAHLHLALATRVDPPLPLARLRARGELVELRAADLRFSLGETGDFFRQGLGLPVTPQEVEALNARTEGWAVGLRLAALAMESLAREAGQTSGAKFHPPSSRLRPASPEALSDFIQAFTGSNQYILDYLVEEVLARQPQALQDFLMRTAILERLNAELCEAVLAGQPPDFQPGGVGSASQPAHLRTCQQILEFLDHNNLFVVPLDHERCWFRYHHLFAEILRHRLNRLARLQVPELHARAAVWLEEHSDLEASVGHWLKAGDLPNTARLVEAHAFQMLEAGRLELLLSWIGHLPEEVILGRSWLCVDHAWALILVGQPEAAEARLQAAEAGGAALAAAEKGALQGHIDAIRAYAAALQSDTGRALQLGQAALERLPEADISVRGIVAFTLGGVAYLSGDLEGAGQAFTQAAEMGRRSGNLHLALPALRALAGLQALRGKLHSAVQIYRDMLHWVEESLGRAGLDLPITASAHTGLGELFYEWNNLEAAIPELERGARLAEGWGNAPALTSCLLSLARARQAQGQNEAAEDLLQHCEALSHSIAVTATVESNLAAARLRWLLRQADLTAARRLAGARALPHRVRLETGELLFWREAEYLAEAWLTLAEGDPASAIELLERLQAAAESSGRAGSLVAILPLKALALQARRKPSEALQALTRALELARPEGFTRTFLDCGPPLLTLLERIDPVMLKSDLQAFRRQLLEAFRLELHRREFPAPGSRPAPPSTPVRQPAGTLVEPLTERELEVLRLVAAGLSNEAIARKLVISLGTVKAHTYSIYQKLAVSSRTQAAARARELNLL